MADVGIYGVSMLPGCLHRVKMTIWNQYQSTFEYLSTGRINSLNTRVNYYFNG